MPGTLISPAICSTCCSGAGLLKSGLSIPSGLKVSARLRKTGQSPGHAINDGVVLQPPEKETDVGNVVAPLPRDDAPDLAGVGSGVKGRIKQFECVRVAQIRGAHVARPQMI